MSDYNSSLPVRTENDGDVVSKIGDGTTPSQYLKVLADGSINVNDNGGSLTVDASDLDIRDLVFATDKVDASGSVVALDAPTLAALESITVQNGAGGAAVNIQDGGNSITVDAVDLDIRNLSHTQDSIKIGDGTDFLAVNVDGSINSVVTATDLDIRDLSAATDSVSAWLKDATGTAFSASNPLYVTSVDGSGTEINDYNTAAAVAAAASSNHDYTIPAGNPLLFKRVWASASGKMKIEVQIDIGAGYVTKYVGFNSTANPNIDITLAPIQLAPTNKIRIIRTNKDNQSQDLYSTIEGVILP